MLSERITSVPGASEVFCFGLCSYANNMKQQVLGVRAETLASHGAVSPQTAAEMAFGAMRVAGANIGVGITGIAGPGGGTQQKPVGLVYVAAAQGAKAMVKQLHLGGRGREIVRLMATQHALDMVRRLLWGLPIEDVAEYGG
jgi:nicotinamide-nucleotide amidase